MKTTFAANAPFLLGTHMAGSNLLLRKHLIQLTLKMICILVQESGCFAMIFSGASDRLKGAMDVRIQLHTNQKLLMCLSINIKFLT